MTVAEAARLLEGTILAAPEGAAARQLAGGHVSDLLSEVIANAGEGFLWVTLQRHVNVVAVAELKQLACVVLVDGRRPEPEALERAQSEGLPIISTALGAWEAVGILHARGLPGRREP
jgi:hypothetical protein